MFQLKEEDLILSTNINSYMCKRVKQITEGFNNQAVIWNMNGLDATLDTETNNKENTSTLVKGIPLNKEIDNKMSKMVSLPFVLDINSDVQVDAYQVGKKNEIMVCKFSMNYFGIPITIYTHSIISKGK